MSTNVTTLNNSSLSKRMALLRKEKGLTLQDLAVLLGLSRVTCGYYESEKRRPDSDIVAQMCRVFDVSADYLLGLSDTRKPEYAEISKTTGLSEDSIAYLNTTIIDRINIINHLLCEEPSIDPFQSELPSDIDNPIYIEKQYAEHLKYIEWENENNKKSILEHVKNDWSFNEQSPFEDNSITSLDENEEIAKEDFSNIDPTIFGPIDDYALESESRFLEAVYEFEAKEAKKSNLLSAIADYVSYVSGCTLETLMKTEKLTNEHQINIGTGNGNRIAFPSKKGDELLEFMLLQKVIDALKKFKENYYLK